MYKTYAKHRVNQGPTTNIGSTKAHLDLSRTQNCKFSQGLNYENKILYYNVYTIGVMVLDSTRDTEYEWHGFDSQP